MNRQEKTVLLGLAVLAIAGGIVKVRVDASGDFGSAAADARESLRRSLVNATSTVPDNNWTCPEWSIKSVGGSTVHKTHPLYRRPKFIGQNRHKIMSEGWAGWYYNPPGDDYF